MKVLVCGSRTWTDADAIAERLAAFPADPFVLHGGASGADYLAGEAATFLGFGVARYFPNWNRDGKRAGILRNLAMLDEHPDLVLAFWDGKSRGTAHTIAEARRRGIPVEVVVARDGERNTP